METSSTEAAEIYFYFQIRPFIFDSFKWVSVAYAPSGWLATLQREQILLQYVPFVMYANPEIIISYECMHRNLK